MQMYELILKKKAGQELTKEELNAMISGYTKGDIPDYQMSAFLMAVCFQGMTEQETTDLTLAMADSGDRLDLSAVLGMKVDKHSTGGVGDKTSLLLGPMVASLKIPVAKMSGRGLGHTGGTIDKLESIPGFCASITEEEFFQTVNTIGLSIMSQTKELAPADKKMYALRDVTGTVDSLALIASSIMSKKLAAGADVLVLDVKAGNGAFMKTKEEAFRLAEVMVNIGTRAGKKTYAVVTDMNQPLGYAVGNALEVKEAVQMLKGETTASDLLEDCLVLGSYMVYGTGAAKSPEQAKELLKETIKNGSAFKKLKQFVAAQGGDSNALEDLSLLPQAEIVEEVTAPEAGFLSAFDTQQLGMVSLILGGGRETKDAAIDPSVGFWLRKKLGDRVESGEALAVFYANSREKFEAAKQRFLSSVQISHIPPVLPEHIYGVVEL